MVNYRFVLSIKNILARCVRSTKTPWMSKVSSWKESRLLKHLLDDVFVLHHRFVKCIYCATYISPFLNLGIKNVVVTYMKWLHHCRRD